MDFGILIVAFNPDEKKLQRDILTLSSICRQIIIVNNGPAIALDLHPAVVLELGGNKGIASAHNAGIDYLRKQGVSLAFLMDQDSTFSADFFTSMLNEWAVQQPRSQRLALLSPTVVDTNLKRVLPTYQVNNGTIQTVIPEKSALCNTLPIASGSLVSIAAFEDVGGESDAWFIDWVDFDFDLALLTRNWKTITTPSVQLFHQIGQTTPRRFFGKTIYPSNHPQIRDYYYIRNGLWLVKKYGTQMKNLRIFVHKKLRNRVLFGLYESRPVQRMWIMLQGFMDGHDSYQK